MKNAIVITVLALTAAGCARGPIEPAEGGAPEQKVAPTATDHLTPLQYEITQNCGTEPPFQNEFWDHKEPGLYLDIVSGTPLFASTDKFDSGSGWPSFTRPLEADLLVEKPDYKLFTPRTEVRSAGADSHLGHVFGDGPGPDGLRYCINSAALRFVHVRDLEKEGLGEYLDLFPAELREQASAPRTEFAYLAGGCFWGMEDILRELPGVVDTEVGYCGPKDDRAEAVRVEFDPDVLTYDALLDVFFRMHDPTTQDRQGNDVGRKYRSALFTTGEAQVAAAAEARDRAAKSGRWSAPIVTEVTPFTRFEPAQEFHQDYLEKRPGGYTCHYLRD